ncbi:MAG: SET domain-containing protein-lysine N-methyltransferase [Pseudomonadota bacterium]
MKLRDKFQILTIAGKGRGVAAAMPLHVGEVLEIAPTVLLNAEECSHVEQTALGNYYFAHPSSEDDGLIILGIASLLNHSETPNAEVTWCDDPHLGLIAVLRALKPIATGEEITRRYRCHPWFPVAA